MKPTAIVVGGGVIGLSVAWELSRRGIGVTVLERNRVGQATSWAGAGILPPANEESATDPIDKLRGISHRLYPQWASDLHAQTGIDPELRRTGGLYLAQTPGERASMIGMTDYWHSQQIKCALCTPQELVNREPGLASWVDREYEPAAWFVPDEYQIRSPRHLRALAKACEVAGVQIREDVEVSDLRMVGEQTEVQFLEEWHFADSIVLTAGAWTGRIAPRLQLDRSVIPIRGQILLLKTERPVAHSVINVGHRYVVARDDGHTLIGSCEEETGFELGTTDAMLDSLHQFASDLFPELATAERIAGWSGLRPMTFDGFPMIGRVPDFHNLYIAAGHYRSGLHLAPGTAVLVSDLIEGVQPCVDPEPFRVGKQQHDHVRFG